MATLGTYSRFHCYPINRSLAQSVTSEIHNNWREQTEPQSES